MAWCWPGDKPLSEPLMVKFHSHICVIRLLWVNESLNGIAIPVRFIESIFFLTAYQTRICIYIHVKNWGHGKLGGMWISRSCSTSIIASKMVSRPPLVITVFTTRWKTILYWNGYLVSSAMRTMIQVDPTQHYTCHQCRLFITIRNEYVTNIEKNETLCILTCGRFVFIPDNNFVWSTEITGRDYLAC